MNYADALFINKCVSIFVFINEYKYEIGLLFIQIMYPTHIRQHNDMVGVDCDAIVLMSYIFYNIVIISIKGSHQQQQSCQTWDIVPSSLPPTPPY
jgi:hypothetical protein